MIVIAGGARPGTRTAPSHAHVSPPTRPEPPLQLVRSRFADFSKIGPFHSLTAGLCVECVLKYKSDKERYESLLQPGLGDAATKSLCLPTNWCWLLARR